MSKPSKSTPTEAEPAAPGGDATLEAVPAGRRKLVVMAVPGVLVLLGVGPYFMGFPSALFGTKHPSASAAAAPTLYVDLPEMVANLDSDPRRPRYIKLRARIEVKGADNQKAVQQSMPRLEDLFQTYLRDVRPDDVRGSMGTYRLREELIARADIAVAPAHVADVLFAEMLVQ